MLADHIKKNDMIMIYRVSNLDNTASTLRSQGWKEAKTLEIINTSKVAYAERMFLPSVLELAMIM